MILIIIGICLRRCIGFISISSFCQGGLRITSGCVKTHVCMKNKLYTSFKSENKVKIRRIWFFHTV
uniref:Uncharacterized protein n=1 Tax=Uncultured archaeon GZfos26G2 TaxID=3386331 RepID=Q64A61_UNCAG|nr:hypothetical protein GZ33E1_13 [uncultured archaeon GZfos33E1]